MTDRKAAIVAFLRDAGWSGADQAPLAGDLSTRHYTRLTQQDQTAILMDADAPMADFMRITDWLRSIDLSAPQIIYQNADQGLLLLEDFGNQSMTHLVGNSPALETKIYQGCVDLLLHIRASAPPPGLHAPDAVELVDWTRLADTHLDGVDAAGLTTLRDVMTAELTRLTAQPAILSLRDFHADNVMWLADRTGIQRFGLLDYQDAFLTHPVYDLVSLLTDARRQITPFLKDAILTYYADQSGDELATLQSAFAVFSVQRNLRILGIFAKSAALGKDHHLPKMPRVMGYVTQALNHPVFAHCKDEARAALPELGA